MELLLSLQISTASSRFSLDDLAVTVFLPCAVELVQLGIPAASVGEPYLADENLNINLINNL